MLKAMDYSFSRPPYDQVDVVFRYLGDGPAALTKQEADQIHAAGKGIALCFEQGAAQAEQGAQQGARDSVYANGHADSLGAPDFVWIWYAVDTAASEQQVRDYFGGIKAMGRRPAGVYGGLELGLALQAEGLVSGVWVADALSWSDEHTWAQMVPKAQATANVLQFVTHPLPGVPPNEYDYDEIYKPFPTWASGPTPPPQKKGHKMFQLFVITDAPDTAQKAAVWCTDGVQRSWVQTPAARDALIVLAQTQGLPTNIAHLTAAQAATIPVVGPTPA